MLQCAWATLLTLKSRPASSTTGMLIAHRPGPLLLAPLLCAWLEMTAAQVRKDMHATEHWLEAVQLRQDSPGHQQQRTSAAFPLLASSCS